MDANSESIPWPLPRLWAIFLCTLIGVTYRLWCVQADVPPVVMFSFAKLLPDFASWLPLVLILVGAVSVIAKPEKWRGAWWLVVGGLVFAFVLDQHRLQPWAYQSSIYAVVFAVLPAAAARRLLIPLAASVYIYSAAGKLDYQFAHTVGQDFLSTLLGPLGVLDWLTDATRTKLALSFPIIELIAGLTLLPVRTRRYAAMVLIGMHGSLLLILGPWGLNHSLGVLIWNVALAVQAYYLFIAPDIQNAADPDRDREPIGLSRGKPRKILGRWLASGVVLIAILAPATERAGLWDHWTSWSLYSPHSSRVDVEIHQSEFDALPPTMRQYFRADDDHDGWHRLALDQWSLQSLAVPIYPQARYQLALAYEVVQQSGMDARSIRCRARGVSDRINGTREESLLMGTRDITRKLREYWLVALPPSDSSQSSNPNDSDPR